MPTLGEAVVRITTDNSKFRKDLHKAENDTRRSARKMSGYFDNIRNSVNQLGNRMSQLGKQLTRRGGIGLAATAAGMTALLKPAGDLEEQIANINTLFSDTTANTEEMTDQILELSRIVPKSTKTLSEGLYQIKSAGIEADEMFNFLTTSAVAATAGVTDVEATVRALTKTLSGFGMESSEVSSVADMMFRTVEKGQVTFGELAESLPTVTGAASNAGVSIEEMLGAFAAGSKVLKDTQQTAVGLAGMLRSIGKATEEQKALARELGFEFNEQALATKGLVGFLDDMRKALDGTDVSLREFFRREQGYRLAVALLTNNFDELEQNIEDVRDSDGAITRAFQKQMDTFNNQVHLAWNNISALAKAIGTELLPEYTDFAKQVRAIASVLNDRFANASDEARQKIADMISTIAKATAGFFGFITVAGLLSLAFGLILKSVALVAGVMSLLLSPITWLIAGVLLLATAWKENWWGIREKTQAAYDEIKPILKDLWEWLQKAWDWTIDIAGDAWDWIRDTTWQEKLKDMKRWLTDGWDWVINLIKKGAKWFWDYLEENFPEVADKLETSWTWTIDAFGNIWDWLTEKWESISSWFNENITTEWDWKIKGLEWIKKLFDGEKVEYTGMKGVIDDIAQGLQIPSEVGMALAESETGFRDINKQEATGVMAQGPLQVTPIALKELENAGIETDMETQAGRIQAGLDYANLLLTKYADSLDFIVDAYPEVENRYQALTVAYRHGPTISNLPETLPEIDANRVNTMKEYTSKQGFKKSIETTLDIIPDFTVSDIAETAIGAIADALGWVHEKGYAYDLGHIVGNLTFKMIWLGFKAIQWLGGLLAFDNGDQSKLQMSVNELIISVGQIIWDFGQGFSDALYQQLFEMDSEELGEATIKPFQSWENFFEWSKRNVNSGNDSKKQGGMTSGGVNQVAGVVHGGEWVMPAWMVDRFPQLTSMLEGMRQGKGFKAGGLVGYQGGSYVTRARETLSIATDDLSKTAANVMGILSTVLENMFGLIIDQLKKQFPELAEELETAFDEAKKLIEDLKKAGGEDDDSGGKDLPLIKQMYQEDRDTEELTKWGVVLKNTKNIMLGVVNALQKQIPILQDMIKQNDDGTTSFKSLSAIIFSLIRNSKAFQEILKVINPIFQILADTVGVILLPILKVLGPGLKLLAKIIKWVGKTIAKVWNGLVKALEKILFGLVDLSGWLIDIDKYFGDAADAADNVAEALNNVPSGFKYALQSFRAAVPSAATGGLVSRTGLVNVHAGEVIQNKSQQQPQIVIQGDVYGWNDFKNKVAEAQGEINRDLNMADIGVGTV